MVGSKVALKVKSTYQDIFTNWRLVVFCCHHSTSFWLWHLLSPSIWYSFMGMHAWLHLHNRTTYKNKITSVTILPTHWPKFKIKSCNSYYHLHLTELTQFRDRMVLPSIHVTGWRQRWQPSEAAPVCYWEEKLPLQLQPMPHYSSRQACIRRTPTCSQRSQ